MKSFFLSILCLLTLPELSIEAQVIKALGVKGGVVAATETFDFNIDITTAPLPNIEVSSLVKYRWGLDLAGFVEFFDHSPVSLLTELHYVQKGYVTTLGGIDYSSRVDYLSVPLLAKLQLMNGTAIPYACAGPRFDFLLEKQQSLDYSSTDVGLSLGAGLQVLFFSTPQLLIEGRFSPSFTDAFHNPNLTVKNESFEILVGASF